MPGVVLCVLALALTTVVSLVAEATLFATASAADEGPGLLRQADPNGRGTGLFRCRA